MEASITGCCKEIVIVSGRSGKEARSSKLSVLLQEEVIQFTCVNIEHCWYCPSCGHIYMVASYGQVPLSADTAICQRIGMRLTYEHVSACIVDPGDITGCRIKSIDVDLIRWPDADAVIEHVILDGYATSCRPVGHHPVVTQLVTVHRRVFLPQKPTGIRGQAVQAAVIAGDKDLTSPYSRR